MKRTLITAVIFAFSGAAYCAGFETLAVSASGLKNMTAVDAGVAPVPMLEPVVVPEAPSGHGPFIFNPAVNERIAAKLDIPVFFALPESAYLQPPGELDGMDGLWAFRHPGAAKAAAPVGLRVYLTRHENVAARLAAGGLVQTGDVILTFRPEWGFQGPYPNIQMGISHAGLAVVKDGVVTNVDNPLTDEYLGTLSGKHYRTSSALHIIRPRGMGAVQKENLMKWAERFTGPAAEIYPAQLSFNRDYFSPKYTPDLKFIRTVARIALGQDKASRIDLYCAEFVWALLALKDCDPGQPEVFAQEGVPACVKPVFAPLPIIGNYFIAPRLPSARLGLSDGPLAVIDSMGLPENDRGRAIHEVFERKRRLSPGHAAAAESLAPFYRRLEGYYTGIHDGAPQSLQIMDAFNSSVKPNYSPASYLINALLPADSEERSMDVVGTVVFSD